MDTFIDFFSLSDPNVRYVVLGVILLSASSAIVGTFTFLQKKALVGDAVAHAVLPGVCLSFIISGTKDPILLVIGAFLTGWISLVLIDKITENSRIKEDTAIGLILSVFFGIGILLLTYIQHSGNANQSGLDSFLFGKAASLVAEDLQVFSIVSISLIIMVIIFFKELALISFDGAFARTIGLPVGLINLLLTTMTVMAVVVGIQAVGVVLMAAMLITPAASARFWTDNLIKMLFLAAGFAIVAALIGTYISYLAPRMPTGPWVVVVLSMFAFFSFFFSPKKGILKKQYDKRKFRKKMEYENILKAITQIDEQKNFVNEPVTKEEIINKRYFDADSLSRNLRKLKNEGYLDQKENLWVLTTAGINRGKRVIRLHRLWEVYLTQYLNIAPDHVHEDAENIEHILTPELEERLEKLLKFPRKDPHDSTIPYE